MKVRLGANLKTYHHRIVEVPDNINVKQLTNLADQFAEEKSCGSVEFTGEWHPYDYDEPAEQVIKAEDL